MYRVCNDTPLAIEHLFFSGSDSAADVLAGADFGPGGCSSYTSSAQLRRGFRVTFLVGDNDQYSAHSDAAGLLPYGFWSFRIKLVDRAKHDIAVEPGEDHPTVYVIWEAARWCSRDTNNACGVRLTKPI